MPSGKEQETAVRGKRQPHGFKQDATGNPTYTGFNERWKGKHSTQDPQSNGRRAHLSLQKARDETGLHDGCFGITRNKRTVWWINPQPRPEAHFATFPDELAETCIKAGTSEYGCCPVCGAPWERVVETEHVGASTNRGGHLEGGDGNTGNVYNVPHDYAKREFKGWQPTCTCGETDLASCVVLDPFMGSGTVAVIARDLNRSSIGIELNPEYVKIIKERLHAHSQLDTGVIQYRFEQVPV